jgi:homocysteine S-methyltransferase
MFLKFVRNQKELVEWHKPRVEALLEAGVDLLAFETIPSVKEATALCSILSQYPEARAWLSFSCKASPSAQAEFYEVK